MDQGFINNSCPWELLRSLDKCNMNYISVICHFFSSNREKRDICIGSMHSYYTLENQANFLKSTLSTKPTSSLLFSVHGFLLRNFEKC